MRFLSKVGNPDVPNLPNTTIGIGSSFRGTLMVSGTLRIEGELEGDVLNCERLEIEVKEAVIEGRVYGNVRALGILEMKAGARVEGDVAAMSVVMEPGVHFTGRCTMLENGSEAVEMGGDLLRTRG